MFRKNSTVGVLLFVTFALGFTVALGISYWEWTKFPNIIFYVVALGGVSYAGLQSLLGIRDYRRALGRKLESSSQISVQRVSLPALPKIEILKLEPDFLDTVDNVIQLHDAVVVQSTSQES